MGAPAFTLRRKSLFRLRGLKITPIYFALSACAEKAAARVGS
jgi:hypothetical protein